MSDVKTKVTVNLLELIENGFEVFEITEKLLMVILNPDEKTLEMYFISKDGLAEIMQEIKEETNDS